MHPVIVELPFGLKIYSYGLMLAIGIIVGINICTRLAEKEGYPREFINSCLMWTVIGSILGSRLMDVFVNFDRYAKGFPLSIFNFKIAGLVAYGGFLGGTITAFAYGRMKNAPFLRFADCAAPTLALGMGFTRIGCFLAGCDFGKPSALPWAIQFPRGSDAFNTHQSGGLLDPTATASLPVHPTQIYESLFGFLLFAGLMWLYRKRTFHGEVIAGFFGGYAIFRFAIEFIRGDLGRGGFWAFSTSQWIALGTAVFAAIIVARFRGQGIETAPAMTQARSGARGGRGSGRVARPRAM